MSRITETAALASSSLVMAALVAAIHGSDAFGVVVDARKKSGMTFLTVRSCK